MGNAYECKCTNPTCGYKSIVSGGKKLGMFNELETMVCLDCKELIEVEIAQTAPTKTGFKAVKKKCEECGSGNLKKFYKGKTQCPKCGGKLTLRHNAWVLWD